MRAAVVASSSRHAISDGGGHFELRAEAAIRASFAIRRGSRGNRAKRRSPLASCTLEDRAKRVSDRVPACVNRTGAVFVFPARWEADR